MRYLILTGKISIVFSTLVMIFMIFGTFIYSSIDFFKEYWWRRKMN